MISTADVRKMRVYVRNSKGDPRKFGRIRATVFHPTELRAIGYAIKRPDALLMVKRSDRFAALDRIEEIDEGLCVVDAPDSWDQKACKRLDVDYDTCVIWENMPVRTISGQEVGEVSAVVFDPDSGLIDHIDISSNAANKLILGASNISADLIRGYRDGAIEIEDLEEGVDEEGGLAAKAGETWAKTKHDASKEAAKVGKKAGEAINDGAFKAGEAIGTVRNKANEIAENHKEKKKKAEEAGEYVGVEKAANLFGQKLGKASGMFKGFKEEFDKASKDE